VNATLLAGIVVAVVLLALGTWYFWKQRRRSTIGKSLAAIAIEHLEDVVIPDGMEGEIHIEHLLLTRRGVLVLNIKSYEGVVFAADKLDQWTVIGPAGRLAFNNPLPSLYDRVAAVRQLLRDVDVAGFVVFPAGADFSKGRPDDVLLPEDLIASYAKPDKADLGRLIDAFGPHWETLRAATRPASM